MSTLVVNRTVLRLSGRGTRGLRGATIWPTTGAPSNSLGSNGDYAIDSAALVFYPSKANGAWPAGIPFSLPSTRMATHSANYAVSGSDFGSVLRFNATAGQLVVTVNRNLGSLVSTGLYTVHKFDIERDPADATTNPIIIQDGTGAERGRIVSPAAAGLVPFLTVYADGTAIVCRGTP